MIYNDDIIDTHMHLWDLQNDYPWLKNENPQLEKLVGNYDKLKRNFLVKDYVALTNKHRVVKSVHIEALAFPNDPVLETKWVQEQSEKFGFPHGIIAHANLADPNIEATLQQHCKYPNMRGIRMILNYHDIEHLRMTDRPDYMRDAQWLKGFSLLSKYNLLFEFQIYVHQIADAINVAKKFPTTTIVMEHFAWPQDPTPAGFKEWQDNYKKIAECPNIIVKLSCFALGVLRNADVTTIKKYINSAVDLVGADRCMFGSNFPPDSLKCDFDTLMDIYKQALSIYSKDDQRKMFYENAERVYRL